MYINHSILNSFVALFEIHVFEGGFNLPNLPLKSLSECLVMAVDSAAKKAMETMEGTVSRKKSALRTSQFLKSEKLALPELGSEQISQVFRSSPATYTYALKDSRTRELFFHIFCE